MENLQPVLFGLTVKDLWEYIHPIALAGWATLIVVPKWKHTFDLVLMPPLIHAVLYASILLPAMMTGEEVVDLNQMESVFAIFGNPDIFFCGWVHYLAFDLLVARGLAMDALDTCNVSLFTYYVSVVPCLVATLYVGPVGYLLYMILRITGVLTPTKEKQQ